MFSKSFIIIYIWQVDLLPWTQRPLHLLQQQAAVKNGTFLLHLHRKLIPINRAAFEYGCKTYLNILRKSSAEDIPLYFVSFYIGHMFKMLDFIKLLIHYILLSATNVSASKRNVEIE